MDERLKRLLPWLAAGVAGAAVCATLAIWAWAERYSAGSNALFTQLVYVKHFAEQGSIFWNTGEAHVDRFPSFLDLAVKALATRFFDRDAILAVFRLTQALVPAASVLVFGGLLWFAREKGLQRAMGIALAGGLLVATSAVLAEGASRMAGAPLIVVVVLLLVGTWLLAPRFTQPVVWAIVIEALLVTLARPEGIVLAVAILLLTFFDSERYAAEDGRTPAGVFVLAIGAYYFWHARYFGTWLPPTRTVPWLSRLETLQAGWHGVTNFGTHWAGFIALVPVIAAPLMLFSRDWKSPSERIRAGVIAVFGLLGLLAAIWAGGDTHLLAPAAALGCVALLVGAATSTGQLHQRLMVAAGILVVLQTADVLTRSAKAQASMAIWPNNFREYLCENAFGRALMVTVPVATIADSGYRRLKYFADNLNVIDEQAMPPETAGAHALDNDRDAQTLELRPEAWLWGRKTIRDRALSDVPLKDVLTDVHQHKYFTGLNERPDTAFADKLAEQYVPASLSLCHKQYNLLVRKDLIDQFGKKGFTIGGSDNASPIDQAAAADDADKTESGATDAE